MKNLYTKFTFTIVLTLFCATAFAQVQSITGKVTDETTKQPLGFATVSVKGTTTATSTDVNGSYKLEVDFKGAENVQMEVSYVGYEKATITVAKGVKEVNFQPKPVGVTFREAVVTGSRVSETILESPVDIKKMGIKDIEATPSGDFYQSMGTMQGVDITTASMGFKSVNMRGFNTTAPVRVVQMIDGMDNQAPGLNFSVGNLVGANDLDLYSVEVVTGAASALYGPNAFQGVVSMKTKNPYDYQGLDVLVKGGSRDMIDGQFRYAKVLGKNKKWALKLTGGYMKAQDWIAKDTATNKYGDIETTQDFSSIVNKLQYDSTISQEDRDKYLALNDYMGFNPVVFRALANAPLKPRAGWRTSWPTTAYQA
ncbi:MAG: carboxypeptidase-like regulatory domain-containing protein [Sphingobacteriales bacterium JAD_PAG50586_3]|nr:MAG: carboxypeptidase-like regulatory domain-containing protein [Sphingobacteriales bacterium JAD_PAG50586_3]